MPSLTIYSLTLWVPAPCSVKWGGRLLGGLPEGAARYAASYAAGNLDLPMGKWGPVSPRTEYEHVCKLRLRPVSIGSST